jgi:acylphosphatase
MKHYACVVLIVVAAIIGARTLSAQRMPSGNSNLPAQLKGEPAQQTAVSKHIIFSGRVQGVGFRNKARSIATSRKLTGFVRNLADGTVEMLVQGKTGDINDCLKDIKKFFSDNIKDTKIAEAPYESKYTDFRVLY